MDSRSCCNYGCAAQLVVAEWRIPRMGAKHTEASKKTVLVVDDERGIREMVSKVLEAAHYNVLSAETGSEGLQVSRAFRDDIDVLVSDFQMDGMSGIDLASAITADRPKIKVLLMSGFPKGLLVLNEGWHFL